LSQEEFLVPVFENHLDFIVRGMKVFVKVEASVTRYEVAKSVARPGSSNGSSVSRRPNLQIQKLKRAGRRIARKGRALEIKAGQYLGGREVGAIRPEDIVWIFGAGRTGSTWLSQMMGELKGCTVWFEPWVGALFDPYHLRLEERGNGKHFILAPEYKSTWLKPIRSFVLDGADARFPELSQNRYLVIKEPGGSVGAPLLMEALPESRMILLTRDPRDAVASWLDARRRGGWGNEDGKDKEGRKPATLADEDPDAYVRRRAKIYLRVMGSAKQAYETHEGRKVLVKYEELRADTLGTMKYIFSTLEIQVSQKELARAVEKHSWENIPEKQKGEGKFFRKATPGAWREDLTPKQAKVVERITTPLLNELYHS
jgi:Sulfotransferase domain